MSNPNSPFGFTYMGWNRGGPAVTGGVIERKIAAANNTPICKGDLVQSLNTGYVAISASGVAGSNTAGVFLGCRYLSTASGKIEQRSFWPNGDHTYDGVAYILPIAGVPPQLFKVQAYTTNFTLENIGGTVDINVGTQTIVGGFGLSGMTIVEADATTSSLPFRVVDLYSSVLPGAPGTDDTSNYNIVIVQSNPFAETGI